MLVRCEQLKYETCSNLLLFHYKSLINFNYKICTCRLGTYWLQLPLRRWKSTLSDLSAREAYQRRLLKPLVMRNIKCSENPMKETSRSLRQVQVYMRRYSPQSRKSELLKSDISSCFCLLKNNSFKPLIDVQNLFKFGFGFEFSSWPLEAFIGIVRSRSIQYKITLLCTLKLQKSGFIA